jgi:hypothetical protein
MGLKDVELKTAPRLPRNTALFLAALLASLALIHGLLPPAQARKPGEPLISAFSEWFQSPCRNTRLEAYFLSAGLPERPEYTKILRKRLAEADPLERVVILYALAVMTRKPEDIDAFLIAFPVDCAQLYVFLDAEYYLSATINTGVADFLLLLVHEPRTRGKALPRLARIACVSAGNELMNTYFEDPYVAEYVQNNRDNLSWPCPEYVKPEFVSDNYFVKVITDLLQSRDMDSKTVAVLMIRRIFDRMEITNTYESLDSGTFPPEEKLLVDHVINYDTFLAQFPKRTGEIQKLLQEEKRLYRPPLSGIVGRLWDDRADKTAKSALQTVLRHGSGYLEECERYYITRLLQGEKP